MDDIKKDAKRAVSRYGVGSHGISFADLLAAQDIAVVVTPTPERSVQQFYPSVNHGQVARLPVPYIEVVRPLQCDPAILTPEPKASEATMLQYYNDPNPLDWTLQTR